MKKAKFLIYAAVAATAAIVSSCSNEDVVEQTPQKGRPIVVEASVDGDSRASVATSFTGFKLYGYDQANEGAQFLNGVGFANSGTAWTSVGAANWPTGTGACDFYAISVDGAAPTALPDNIDITDLATGSFAYTVPTDVADQQDLLVAKQNDVAYADNAGKIKLGFKHALANVQLKLRFNYSEYSTKDDPTGNIKAGYKYAIQYVTLHNVKTTGTYNASTGWDTSEGTLSNVTINFDGGNRDVEPSLILTAAKGTTSNKIPYQDVAVDANSIMVIPQTLEHVDGFGTANPMNNYNGNAAYIEIHGVMWDPANSSYYDDEDNEVSLEGSTPWSAPDYVSGFSYKLSNTMDSHRCVSIYLPLPEALNFDINKKYTLRMNLYNFKKGDGQDAFEAATITSPTNP
jgi:hypothetical protein